MSFVTFLLLVCACSVITTLGCVGPFAPGGGPSSPPTPATLPPAANTTTVGMSTTPINQGTTTTIKPPANTCGYTEYSQNIQTRIVGGVTTMLHEIPWQVRLSLKTSSGAIYLCGGTIISELYILTAAHCCEAVTANGSSITAFISDYDQSNPSNDGEFSMIVAKMTINPSYDAGSQNNDFCLLQLPNTLNFTTWTVQKACLPSNCTDGTCAVGNLATISGWGTLAEGSGVASPVMQKADVTIINQTVCLNDYSGLQTITSQMICAGVPGGGIDACQGDSGGPMTSLNQYSQSILCGVTSFGQGCAEASYPGVYARVCSAMPWIRSIIGYGP